MSEEAIRNLMNAFNTGQQPVTDATKAGTDKVAATVDLARAAIVGAIEANSLKGASKEDKPLSDIVKTALGVKGREIPSDKERPQPRAVLPPRRMGGEVTDDQDYATGTTKAEAISSVISSLTSAIAGRPVSVTVGAMPLKANFNANLTVLLDGQTIAKSIFPILYQMLVKMGSATPAAGGSPGTVRN